MTLDTTYQLPTEGSSGKFVDHEQETKSGQAVLRQRVQDQYPALVQQSYTRQANTTVYATGQQIAGAVAAALPFTAARFNGAGGVITAAHFIDDSNPGTKPTLELWLFGGPAAPTPNNDAAAAAWSDSDLANLIGVIEFTSTDVRVSNAGAGAAGNSVCTGKLGTSPIFELPFRCGPATQLIWGMVIVRTAYTPASGGILKFSLHVRQE